MEIKKSPKADLERSRWVYVLAGVLFASALVLVSMEVKSYGQEVSQLGTVEVEEDDVVLPPVTRRPPPPPPPPPPPVYKDKYKKMISMGIPTAAVNQQQQIDAKASINPEMLLSVKLKKGMPNKGDIKSDMNGFEPPSLDSLQLALQKLRSIIDPI